MPGAHRPPGRRGASAAGIAASSGLAGLAVFALVGALILAFGENGDAETASVGTDLSAELVPLSPGEDPVPLHGATPSPTEAATPTPTVTATATPTATPGATRAATPSTGRVPVVVLNQTPIRGAAATFREVLRAGGWQVPAIGDFRGNVPATTVYYPPGLEAAARALMAQFAPVGRIRPAFAGISTTRLTVILGKDFPRSP